MRVIICNWKLLLIFYELCSHITQHEIHEHIWTQILLEFLPTQLFIKKYIKLLQSLKVTCFLLCLKCYHLCYIKNFNSAKRFWLCRLRKIMLCINSVSDWSNLLLFKKSYFTLSTRYDKCIHKFVCLKINNLPSNSFLNLILHVYDVQKNTIWKYILFIICIENI